MSIIKYEEPATQVPSHAATPEAGELLLRLVNDGILEVVEE